MNRAAKLEALIRKHNLRQGEVAMAIGIPGSRLSEWKSNNWPMPAEIAVKLARALNVTVEYLFDDRLDEPPLSSSKDLEYLLQVIEDSGLTVRDAARRILQHSSPVVEPTPPVQASRVELNFTTKGPRARKS